MDYAVVAVSGTRMGSNWHMISSLESSHLGGRCRLPEPHPHKQRCGGSQWGIIHIFFGIRVILQTSITFH